MNLPSISAWSWPWIAVL